MVGHVRITPLFILSGKACKPNGNLGGHIFGRVRSWTATLPNPKKTAKMRHKPAEYFLPLNSLDMMGLRSRS
jgi:hypothetical protein